MPPIRPAQHLAIASVEAFLADPNWQERAEEYGWKITRTAPLTLIVGLRARPLENVPDEFTLRLLCDYCPMHPPDVQFVNPATHQFAATLDEYHVAKLQAEDCYVNLNYNYSTPYPYGYGSQLVCSSVTLGYYFSGHTPTPEQQWNPQRDSLGKTINVVYRTLQSKDYHGRNG